MQSPLLKTLGESPQMKIINFYINNPLTDFTKKEAYKEIGMNQQTYQRHFKTIKQEGIISKSRNIGKAKLYKLNTLNPLTKNLIEINEQLNKNKAKRKTTLNKALELDKEKTED